MRTKVLLLGLLCLAAVSPSEPEVKVTSLISKEMKDIPGKEGLMIAVEYAPGGADPVHRHDAHGFIYVLEGSVVMQVKGGKEVTLKPGETFYEGPDDLHVVGRNASKTEPAKFLVFLVKEKGAPVLIPEE
jgi:quercetin dioxygenase-like cupin family protein